MMRWLAMGCMCLTGCVSVQHQTLYEWESQPQIMAVPGLSADVIYADAMGNDVWFTSSASCIRIEPQAVGAIGTQCMRIQWDKPGGGCDWVGMGIGWDGWTGKNFQQCVNQSALQFKARSLTGPMKGLPWAVGFEDFNGGQAWSGFNGSMIQGGVIDREWTAVTVPLYAFPFDDRDVDVTAIKQVIFQFESSGTVEMDDIRIVPYDVPRIRSMAVSSSDLLAADGQFSAGEWTEWQGLGKHKLALSMNQTYLGIAGEMLDDSPCMNDKSGKDIWNGDAVEIAFSSDDAISKKRPFFYETDRHFGIQLRCDAPSIWDWSSSRALNGSIRIWKADGKVMFETLIPWSELKSSPWQSGKTYQIECAIDEGEKQGRTNQLRWNSSLREGFHLNPSLWGILNVK
ncbi:MAG: hypothetical protein ACKO6L_04755 [Flavobacteriales bacterium]